MASTAKCPFCGAIVTSDQKTCPECGGANPHYIEDTPRRILEPKTIEELKEYCAERGMPLLRMRFFIGDNTQEARAFGICRDGDKFLVYKNKADGSRAVRYHGPDEAHAVKEIHTKLLDECHARGIYPDGRPAAGSVTRSGLPGAEQRETLLARKAKASKSRKVVLIVMAVLILFAIGAGVVNHYSRMKPQPGYYIRDGKLYHYSDKLKAFSSGWHEYTDGWKSCTQPASAFQLTFAGGSRGQTYDPSWGGEEITFYSEKAKTGYYRYDNETYFCRNGKWALYNARRDAWGILNGDQGFPFHDENNYLINPESWYAGTDFDPEWGGCEYETRKGYYRYEDKTWYYEEETSSVWFSKGWYQYDGQWKTGNYPVGNFGKYYEGENYRTEWGGEAFPVISELKKGYYLCQETLFYQDGKTKWFTAFDPKLPEGVQYSYRSTFSSLFNNGWYRFKGKWESYSLPRTLEDGTLIIPDDYYEGQEYRSEWGGCEYNLQDGYYRYNGETYYAVGNTWYLYSGGWREADYPVSDFSDYYAGTDLQSDWSASAFRDPNAPSGNSSSGSGSSGSSSSGSRWDSDWDSGSDYDSWDSSDSDWDSDW